MNIKEQIEIIGESEQFYQKAIIEQIYKTIFPFIKPSICSNEIPDLLRVFNEYNEIEKLHPKEIILQILNKALEKFYAPLKLKYRKSQYEQQLKKENSEKQDDLSKRDRKMSYAEKSENNLIPNEEQKSEPVMSNQAKLEKIEDLYENNYKNLAVLLTILCPEFLIDSIFLLQFGEN